VPTLQQHVRGGDDARGGIVGYPLDSLYEEVAFVAYHFHWTLEAIMDLPHGERQRFVDEISTINRQMNEPSTGQQRGIPLQDLI
jgi:hypothetical protein